MIDNLVKNYFIVVFLFITLLQSTNLFASNTKNLFIISNGINDFQTRDEMFAPLNYRAKRTQTELQLLNISPDTRKTLSLSFTGSEIDTRYNNLKADNMLGSLSIEYSKKIQASITKLNNLDLYLGGVYDFLFDSMIYEKDENVNASWFSTNSFNFSVSAHYRFPKRHFFFIQAFTPLLSYVTRPPYAGFDAKIADIGQEENVSFYRKFSSILIENGQWVSLNDFRGLSIRTTYLYPVYSRLQLGFEYRLRFLVIEILRESRIFSQNFSLSLALNF